MTDDLKKDETQTPTDEVKNVTSQVSKEDLEVADAANALVTAFNTGMSKLFK